MSDLKAQVDGLVAERAALVARLQAIDAELDAVRVALALPGAVTDGSLPDAILAYLREHGPTTLFDLRIETGRSLHRVHLALGALRGRVDVLGNTGRRFARLTGDPRTLGYVAPAKRPRALASRTQDVTCAREGCGVVFRPSGGTTGRYCSRACYDAARATKPPQLAEPRQAQRSAPTQAATPVAAPVAAPRPTCVRCGQPFTPKPGVSGRFCSRACYAGTPKPVPPAKAATPDDRLDQLKRRSTVVAPPIVNGERRCSRCLKKFRPATVDARVCAECLKKPIRLAEPEPEVDRVVWDGSKGSLTGHDVGSTLKDAGRS